MSMFRKAFRTAPVSEGSPPTAGWVVQIKTLESANERICTWIVAQADWAKAQEIATKAQGLRADSRVLTIRVRRSATAAELQGLALGAARQMD